MPIALVNASAHFISCSMHLEMLTVCRHEIIQLLLASWSRPTGTQCTRGHLGEREKSRYRHFVIKCSRISLRRHCYWNKLHHTCLDGLVWPHDHFYIPPTHIRLLLPLPTLKHRPTSSLIETAAHTGMAFEIQSLQHLRTALFKIMSHDRIPSCTAIKACRQSNLHQGQIWP